MNHQLLDTVKLNTIKDICYRVFGYDAEIEICSDTHLVSISIVSKRKQDALTQSQQEMDAILSIQHLLSGYTGSVRLICT